jgi:hypothetical protein
MLVVKNVTAEGLLERTPRRGFGFRAFAVLDMGTILKVELDDEFFESLFKEDGNMLRCIKGVPKEAKLMEIKSNPMGKYVVVFQLPEQMIISPVFETRC